MTNYPLFEMDEKIANNPNFLQSYLSIFPHEIWKELTQDGMTLVHFYPDGLTIKTQWIGNREVLEKVQSYQDLLVKRLNYSIGFKTGKILKYSKPTDFIPKEVQAKYDFVLSMSGIPAPVQEKPKMSREEYKAREFNTDVNLPDEFFDNLLSTSQKYGQFFKFLKQRNSQ